MFVKSVTTSVKDYKETGLLVGFPNCTFKCCRENNLPLETCQNRELVNQESVFMSPKQILKKYYNPEIHKCLILGGLEPFDNYIDTLLFIIEYDAKYPDGKIIIYTGYEERELRYAVEKINTYNIGIDVIIKFGRFIPNKPSIYDEVLGVTLSSDNQYAKKIN